MVWGQLCRAQGGDTEQAQEGGRTAPARWHLQSMGSFLGALGQSGQTCCVDSFRRGVGVSGDCYCAKSYLLQPSSHSSTQPSGTRPLLCTRLGTKDAEVTDCSQSSRSYQIKWEKHSKEAYEWNCDSRRPRVEWVGREPGDGGGFCSTCGGDEMLGKALRLS